MSQIQDKGEEGLIACGRTQLSMALSLAPLLCTCTATLYHPHSDGSGCTKWTTQGARRLLSVTPWYGAHVSVRRESATSRPPLAAHALLCMQLL